MSMQGHNESIERTQNIFPFQTVHHQEQNQYMQINKSNFQQFINSDTQQLQIEAQETVEDSRDDQNDKRSNSNTRIIENNRDNIGPAGSKIMLNDTIKKKSYE